MLRAYTQAAATLNLYPRFRPVGMRTCIRLPRLDPWDYRKKKSDKARNTVRDLQTAISDTLDFMARLA